MKTTSVTKAKNLITMASQIGMVCQNQSPQFDSFMRAIYDELSGKGGDKYLLKTLRLRAKQYDKSFKSLK